MENQQINKNKKDGRGRPRKYATIEEARQAAIERSTKYNIKNTEKRNEMCLYRRILNTREKLNSLELEFKDKYNKELS